MSTPSALASAALRRQRELLAAGRWEDALAATSFDLELVAATATETERDEIARELTACLAAAQALRDQAAHELAAVARVRVSLRRERSDAASSFERNA